MPLLPSSHRAATAREHTPRSSIRAAAGIAGPCVGEHLARHRAQPKGIVKLAIGEQPSIGGDDGAAKLQRQAMVKIKPESTDSASPVGFAIAASRSPR